MNGPTSSPYSAFNDIDRMDINAVLALGERGIIHELSMLLLDDGFLTVRLEQAGKLYLMPPYFSFASLDRISIRLTI